uniref:Mitochondrial fission 1 protein n=3 Tax=Caenorhabditis tropicalis TaxID=1561998 RepID=A0A1I7TV18_9PELO
MEMESVLDFCTSELEISTARALPDTRENKINLAIALVGSQKTNEIEEGTALLEQIMKETTRGDDARICVHYLALAHARLQNYDKSLSLLNSLLRTEPSNMQAKGLRNVVEKRMKREGLLGMGLVGGAAVLIGGIVIAGMTLKK